MSIRHYVRLAAVGSGLLFAGSGSIDLYQGPIAYCFSSLDAESAHNLAVKFAKYGVAKPRLPFVPPQKDPPSLNSKVWGMKFSNPIGLAAGFDKHAEAMSGLFAMGFGFVEVGSVTPLPQEGNEKPRVWRLKEDGGVINRYGFNSVGIDVVHDRLFAYDSGGRYQHNMGALGVNLGKNKSTSEENAVNDYLKGLTKLGDLAEYVVINVSSPNTPGLRALQGRDRLRSLLKPLLQARDQLVYKPPIILKIAPDLSDTELQDICTVAMELQIDGMIVSNTTVSRDGLKSMNKDKGGGLSGRPLKKMSTEVLRKVYRLTDGSIPLVGVGGVESGRDAYEKICAGASLVQIYTGLVYHGPWLVERVKKELVVCLKEGGFKDVTQAVGADHRKANK